MLLLLLSACGPTADEPSGTVLWSFEIREDGAFAAEQRTFVSEDPADSRVVTATASGRPIPPPPAPPPKYELASPPKPRDPLDPCARRYAVHFAGTEILEHIWNDAAPSMRGRLAYLGPSVGGHACGLGDAPDLEVTALRDAVRGACLQSDDKEWCENVTSRSARAGHLRFRLQDSWEICVSPSSCAKPGGGAVVYEERLLASPDRRRVDAEARIAETTVTVAAVHAGQAVPDVLVGGLVASMCAQARLRGAEDRGWAMPAIPLRDNALLTAAMAGDDALASDASPAELDAHLSRSGVEGWRCEPAR